MSINIRDEDVFPKYCPEQHIDFKRWLLTKISDSAKQNQRQPQRATMIFGFICSKNSRFRVSTHLSIF